MKQFRTGMAVVAVLGVAACAFAARMVWIEEWLPSSRNTPIVAASASAQSATSGRVLVNGAQPLIPYTTLLISGGIVDVNETDQPLSVTVFVGNRAIAAQVQGNTYTARLPVDQPESMVKVEARTAHTHYVSVLGELRRQIAWAGQDRQLSLDEQPALRASPYSTALYWLTRYAIGNRDAISDREFENAMRAINGKELEAATALIWSAANPPENLAGQYYDGFAQLRDRAYFQQYMTYATGPGWVAEDFFSWQPSRSPLRSLDELPVATVMMSAIKRGVLPHGVDRLNYLERVGPSLYNMSENLALRTRRYNASINARGEVVLEPAAQVWGVVSAGSNNYFRTYVRYTLRRLYRGDRYSQWYVQLMWEDQPLNDSVFERSGTDGFVVSAVDIDEWMHVQDFSKLEAGTLALPRFCDDTNGAGFGACEYTRYRLRADGTGELIDADFKVAGALMPLPANRPGPSLKWNIDSVGGLRVVTNEFDASFWRVEGDDQGVGPVLYWARSLRDGMTMMGVGFAIPQQIAGQAIEQASGNWKGGYEAVTPPTYAVAASDEELQRNVDGTMQRRYVTEDSVGPWIHTTNWQSLDGSLFEKFDFPTLPARTCAETLASEYAWSCTTRLVYQRPLRRIGNRFYGIEEIYEQKSFRWGADPFVRLVSRPTYFDCVSGACTNDTGLSRNIATAASAPAMRSGFRAPLAPRRLLKAAERPLFR